MVKLLKPKIRAARKWVRKVLIVVLTAGVIVGVFCLVFKSDFLTIKYVNCSVKDKTSIADEERWCSAVKRELLGQRILYSKTQAIASQIGYRFLPVGEVKIAKKYPQTVLVQISERKPIAKVSQPGGREYLLDREGFLYAESLPEFRTLHSVTLDLGAELDLGQKVDAEIVPLILLEEVPVLAIKYVESSGIEIKAGQNLTILFSRQKSVADQIRALQMVLKKYRIEGKDLKEVDLRYEQPVIKY